MSFLAPRLGIVQALIQSCTLLRVPHNCSFGDFWRWFGEVGAVINARRCVCGRGNRAWKITPQARVKFLRSKRAKVPVTRALIRNARCKHARGDCLRGGARSNLAVRDGHFEGVVRNGWVCAGAKHTRPTRCTCRELGKKSEE